MANLTDSIVTTEDVPVPLSFTSVAEVNLLPGGDYTNFIN